MSEISEIEHDIKAELIKIETLVDRAARYVRENAHRVIAYAVTEAASLFTLAHVHATTLEHEITVAGAAAIAAAVNKLRTEIK